MGFIKGGDCLGMLTVLLASQRRHYSMERDNTRLAAKKLTSCNTVHTVKLIARPASQENSSLLQILEVYYRVQRDRHLSQIYRLNTIPPYFLTTMFVASSKLCQRLLIGFFPSGLSTKIVYPFLSPCACYMF